MVVFIVIGKMEIKINLTNDDINKLLKRYCYNRGKITVYYNNYGDDYDLYKYGKDSVHQYTVEVAWIGEKPDCLCDKFPTTDKIKDYLLENVVNACFHRALMRSLCGI